MWGTFRRGEQLLLCICVLLLVFFAGVQSSRRRSARPLPPLFEEPTISSVKSNATTKATGSMPRILVHVSGAVRRPGVRQLPAGARFIDAVRAAGGMATGGDLHAVNLAARLQDGQQIVLPRRGENQATIPGVVRSPSQTGHQSSGVANSSNNNTGPAITGKTNVNTATSMQLEALPGIGPAIAARIVQYRRQRGRIRSLEDLDQVKGLGPRKLEAIGDYVTF
jgi:competence protein ComEA